MAHSVRPPLRRLAAYILLGAALNVALAWSLVAIHGRPAFEWPHHNPREDDGSRNHPIAFFVIRRPGAEWVVGCGRPGTLVSRYPEAVKTYANRPWWPRGAVTFKMRNCGAAAGWPFLSLSS